MKNAIDMKNPCLPLLRKLRGIVVINRLLHRACRPRTLSALTALFVIIEREAFGTYRDVDDERDTCRHQCMQFLHGGLPGPRLYAALCRPHIEVLMELYDPRWTVLRLATLSTELNKVQLRRLGEVSKRVWVNDRPLTEWTDRLFKRLMATPYAAYLGLALAVLARWQSVKAQDRPQIWLRQHFSLLLLLMCQQTELKYAARFLYRLLDQLFRQRILLSVEDWPSSMTAFKRRLYKIERLQYSLQRQRGYSQMEALTLVQTYFNDLHRMPAWAVDLRDHLSDMDCQAEYCLKKMCFQSQPIIDCRQLPVDPKVPLIFNALREFLPLARRKTHWAQRSRVCFDRKRRCHGQW